MNNRYKTILTAAPGLAAASFIFLQGSDAYALESVRFAIEEICAHMEGNLGGLLMATAGLGGLISAAFGNMKAMYSCVVTAIGAFTVSSMLSLYFPQAAQLCSGNGGNGAGARTKIERGLLDVDSRAEVSRFDVEKAVKTYIQMGKSEAPISSDSENRSQISAENSEYNQDNEDVDLF
ncbi:MAG TPA: hypothetical protein PKA63_06930 [Oligoflexia bacterium]|nr:hypothetical protein [Oligoflexia bacterium]HMP48384.1 hypothetical protein [Oligoflexia bacterium]